MLGVGVAVAVAVADVGSVVLAVRAARDTGVRVVVVVVAVVVGEEAARGVWGMAVGAARGVEGAVVAGLEGRRDIAGVVGSFAVVVEVVAAEVVVVAGGMGSVLAGGLVVGWEHKRMLDPVMLRRGLHEDDMVTAGCTPETVGAAAVEGIARRLAGSEVFAARTRSSAVGT